MSATAEITNNVTAYVVSEVPFSLPVVNTELRDMMNFTGVQYGKLPATKSFSGDFAIIWTGQWPQGNGNVGYFFSSDGTDGQDDRLVIGDGPTLYGAGFNEVSVSTDSQLHKFKLARISGVATFYVDGTEVTSASYTGTFNIKNIGKQFGGPTAAANFSGVFERIQVFENGDENTGTPVPNLGDIRIDNPDSIYQRDYSQPVGAEFASPTSSTTGWEYHKGTLSSDGQSLTFTNVDTGNLPGIYVQANTTPGAHYKVSGTLVSSTAPYQQQARAGDSPGSASVTQKTLLPGNFEFTFQAVANTTYITFGGGEDGVGYDWIWQDISIREFHGIELKNTIIPGDFEQFERSAGDDYWLGEEIWDASLASANNSAGAGAQSVWESEANSGSIISADGTFTEIQIPNVLTVGALYRKSVIVNSWNDTVATEGIRLDDSNTLFQPTNGVGLLSVDDIADNSKAFIKRAGGPCNVDISNPSFKLVLQYADGAE